MTLFEPDKHGHSERNRPAKKSHPSKPQKHDKSDTRARTKGQHNDGDHHSKRDRHHTVHKKGHKDQHHARNKHDDDDDKPRSSRTSTNHSKAPSHKQTRPGIAAKSTLEKHDDTPPPILELDGITPPPIAERPAPLKAEAKPSETKLHKRGALASFPRIAGTPVSVPSDTPEVASAMKVLNGERKIFSNPSSLTPRQVQEFLGGVVALSERLHVPPSWILAVMCFETAGTFSPAKQAANSSGSGLVQFMKDTIKNMRNRFPELREWFNGTPDQNIAKVRQLDHGQQLYLSYLYFKMNLEDRGIRSIQPGSIKTVDDLYMLVIAPTRGFGKHEDAALYTCKLPVVRRRGRSPRETCETTRRGAYGKNKRLDTVWGDNDHKVEKWEAARSVRTAEREFASLNSVLMGERANDTLPASAPTDAHVKSRESASPLLFDPTKGGSFRIDAPGIEPRGVRAPEEPKNNLKFPPGTWRP